MEDTKTTPLLTERASVTPIEGLKQRNARNTISLDLEAYMPLFDDPDTSDDQKMELLRALYAIIASFVDLGFSLESPPCGQHREDVDPSAQALRDHVYSSHHDFIERFEDAAGSDALAAEEGVEA